MTNKKLIENKLKDLTTDENFKGVNAITIAEMLQMKRNIVSLYLNELVKENKAIKSNTRPVYFKYNLEPIKEKEGLENSRSNEEEDFNDIIGYNGSLKKQIELCKTAVFYPNEGLPIMIVGESGVGKSYLAETIYKYAVDQEIIEKNAPFKIFNCADYANNQELLSANLFGYKKGAYTGAECDTKGILELSNGGFLFLDEVHRLSAEGQEKLFIFLDKGIFRRVGSTKDISNVNVRFIFATTEDPKKTLLKTFLRRIPILIKIPNINSRPVDEKVLLINKFLKEQARKLNKTIKIYPKVLNYFIEFNGEGNIGSLKNQILVACANSYRRNRQEGVIEIRDISKVIDLKDETQFFYEPLVVSNSEDILIKDMIQIIKLPNMDIYNLKEKLVGDLKAKKINDKKIIKDVTELVEYIYYYQIDNKDNYIENMYLGIIKEELILLKQRYGIKLNSVRHKVFSRVFRFFFNQNNSVLSYGEEEQWNSLLKKLTVKFPRAYLLSSVFVKDISKQFGKENIIELEIIFTIMFIEILKENDFANGIIITHGYSTASSIASLSNSLYEKYIYEPFDMSINMSVSEITKEIRRYLKKIDTTKGIIILVDMGSLFELGDAVKDVVKGDIGIINNTTTQIALDVAGKLICNESISDIVNDIKGKNLLKSKFIKNSKMKRAIVVTCFSGVGTSIKIRDMIKECFNTNEVEVIEYEFNILCSKGNKADIFSKYNVILVISTMKLEIESIDVLLLEELLTEKGEEVLKSTLKQLDITNKFDQVNSSIIKYFSIENVINRLTILNPEKVFKDVEEFIRNIELSLDKKLYNDLKMILLMHLSLMIERIFLNEVIVSEKAQDNLKKCNKKVVKIIEDSFSAIESVYKIRIPATEKVLVYQIITSRMPEITELL